MSIRAKIIASILLSAIVAMLAGYTLFSMLALPYVAELEREQLLKKSDRFNLLIEQDLVRLESLATDWGFWDDTYDFVQTRRRDYLETNFTPIWLEKYRADTLMVHAFNGGWTEVLRHEEDDLPVTMLRRLVQHFPGETGAGFVVIEDTPFMLGFSQVKGSNGDREPAGLVVIAQRLDAAWVDSMSQSFGSGVTLTLQRPLAAPRVVFLGDQQARVDLALPMLRDASRQPVVGLEEHRDWRNELDRSLCYLLAIVFALLTLLLLTLYMVLQRVLVAPLRRIEGSILQMVGPEGGDIDRPRKAWRGNDELKTLQALASAAHRIVISQREDLMHERDQFRDKSLLDELTRLYNRRALNQLYPGRIGAVAAPRFCAIIDLDHFKAINDTYGHATGDRVLVTFAELLREHADDGVIIARTGGEEFTITSAVQGDARLTDGMHRLRQATEATLGPKAGLAHPVTVSIGFVISLPDSGWALGDLMHLADTALYQAKAKRNAVVGYEQVRPVTLPADHRLTGDILHSPGFRQHRGDSRP